VSLEVLLVTSNPTSAPAPPAKKAVEVATTAEVLPVAIVPDKDATQMVVTTPTEVQPVTTDLKTVSALTAAPKVVTVPVEILPVTTFAPVLPAVEVVKVATPMEVKPVSADTNKDAADATQIVVTTPAEVPLVTADLTSVSATSEPKVILIPVEILPVAANPTFAPVPPTKEATKVATPEGIMPVTTHPIKDATPTEVTTPMEVPPVTAGETVSSDLKTISADLKTVSADLKKVSTDLKTVSAPTATPPVAPTPEKNSVTVVVTAPAEVPQAQVPIVTESPLATVSTTDQKKDAAAANAELPPTAFHSYSYDNNDD